MAERRVTYHCRLVLARVSRSALAEVLPVVADMRLDFGQSGRWPNSLKQAATGHEVPFRKVAKQTFNRQIHSKTCKTSVRQTNPRHIKKGASAPLDAN